MDLELDAEGHVPRGLTVAGKSELVDLLTAWLAESRAPTIGDVGTFGGKAWIHVDLGAYRVDLNADTKRSAVETFVRDSRRDPERPWPVIANRRGRINKVLFGPGKEPLPGWFAYLVPPLTRVGWV